MMVMVSPRDAKFHVQDSTLLARSWKWLESRIEEADRLACACVWGVDTSGEVKQRCQEEIDAFLSCCHDLAGAMPHGLGRCIDFDVAWDSALTMLAEAAGLVEADQGAWQEESAELWSQRMAAIVDSVKGHAEEAANEARNESRKTWTTQAKRG